MADANEGGAGADVGESVYVDAFGDRPLTPFCTCPAPNMRVIRDGSGRVCTRCGVLERDPQMCTTFYDIVRTRAYRATPGPAARPPFDIDVALQFVFSAATRRYIYHRITSTTRRVVNKDARRVYNVTGVEYMMPDISPTYSQRAFLARCIYQHSRHLTTAQGIDVLVDIITSLPAGPSRGIVRFPWMCVRLYPETERAKLVKLLAEYLRRERGEVRNDPGDCIKRNTAMHTRKSDRGTPDAVKDEEGFHTRLVVVPRNEDARTAYKRELRERDPPPEASTEATSDEEDGEGQKAPAPAQSRQLSRAWSVLCRGLKRRAAPGGPAECRSTSASGRKGRRRP